ncbi:MAG TPA: methyltransferase domain-containing protein [Rhizomicrobium sp.]
MIRYQAAALALKAFSAGAPARTCYRWLGNQLRDGGTIDVDSYAAKAAWLISSVGDMRRVGVAAEIGTGWIHFYGIVLSLAGVPRVDLHDVWDNRQLLRLKRAFYGFENRLGDIGIPKSEHASAKRKLKVIAETSNFEEIYRELGLNYWVAPIKPKNYDLVCSVDVIEHVDANALPSFIRTMYDALAAGGLSLHQIGLDDHLTHYDPCASTKQYLAIPERRWRRWYQNRVQYFNRIPLERLRQMFVDARFEVIESSASIDERALDGLIVAPQFLGQSRESLLATRAYFIHRKPL